MSDNLREKINGRVSNKTFLPPCWKWQSSSLIDEVSSRLSSSSDPSDAAVVGGALHSASPASDGVMLFAVMAWYLCNNANMPPWLIFYCLVSKNYNKETHCN